MDRYQDSQSRDSEDEKPDHQPIDLWLSDDEDDSEDEGEDADWSNASSEQPFSLGLWIQVLWQHPLVFWSGIWAIVFLVAGLAFAGMISPYLSSQTAETVETVPGQPAAVVKPEGGDTLPIWSVGAIAAACAAGSLLISQRLKYQHSRQSLKLGNQAEFEHSSPAPVCPLALPQTTSFQPFQPALPLPAPAAIVPALPSAALEETVVTVVPADEPTPLDWQEASLADLMDIRYRRQSRR